jgi:hypothetical protein
MVGRPVANISMVSRTPFTTRM